MKRRDFIKKVSIGAAGAGAMALLNGCGSDKNSVKQNKETDTSKTFS